MSDTEDAELLLATIQKALKNGTKHYNKAGDLLTTPKEIISCLLEEGEVTFVGRELPAQK